ncbi:hypothetical protein [Segetibacter aerophilus]|uniref:Uncharacterized protein n=1 Tax=Segetibacter aerophilus TaxID=670293 RepID=A0A512BGL9_9BACT|nr:hypothetical protein [Segetibacter aerophilus]GEO11113.1 hypothetical protein SAE01_36090 [Segetibacter aerophilus]
MVRLKLTFLFFIGLLFSNCWEQLWGDNDLGDNFSLLEGDRTEDRIIVYCSGRSAGACMAGTPIVPVYSRHMDSEGQYAEYVETANSNDNFIIAKTVQLKDKRTNYWIITKGYGIDNCDKINCDSIIQSHVLGPLDQNQFQKEASKLKINLRFQ